MGCYNGGLLCGIFLVGLNKCCISYQHSKVNVIKLGYNKYFSPNPTPLKYKFYFNSNSSNLTWVPAIVDYYAVFSQLVWSNAVLVINILKWKLVKFEQIFPQTPPPLKLKYFWNLFCSNLTWVAAMVGY